MPDILIRGMEMPKDGRKHTALLQFLEDGACRCVVEYSQSYDARIEQWNRRADNGN